MIFLNEDEYMQKLYAIGELLIDFTPLEERGSLASTTAFQKNAGGAPANVAAVVALLGGKSTLLSQVGEDGFGTFLVETLKSVGVDTSHLLQTTEGQTSLAFVSIQKNGERDFLFYRNSAADLLYNADALPLDQLTKGDIIHFCSVDLVESPMKTAHKILLNTALEEHCIISFDPNVRLPLWDNHDLYRKTILEFLPFAHILKVSDEELTFITGIEDTEKAIHSLFVGNVEVILFTRGAFGAALYTKSCKAEVPGRNVSAIDTTGAGDAFIGAFLYQLLQMNSTPQPLHIYCQQQAHELLHFANDFASATTQFKGAIPAFVESAK